MELKPGYKQTEVGVIPEDWEVRPLSKITDTKRPICYGIVQTGRPIINGVRCVRVLDIENGRVNTENLITTSVEISAAYKRTLLSKGDLVIALRGKIGELAVIDEELVGANLTRGVALISPLDGYDGAYLCHYLSSPRGKRVFEKNLHGSALQEIPIATLRKIPAVVPPLPEQRAIAAALSDVDSLISGLDQLIAKKRDIKQAAMQQLLTGKQRLPGFSGEWEVKKLGEIFSITAGKSKSKYIEDGGSYLIVDMGAVSTEGKLIAAKPTNYQGDFLHQGDLVMPKDDIGGGNIIGKVAYIGENNRYVLGDHVYALRAKQGSPLFLSYVINSNETNSALRKKVSGTAQLGLGRKSVEEQGIPFPSPDEQTAIATVLTDMDAEITALEQRRDKTRDLKQGMMQELLTGRIRLV